ncbi:type II secretion system F family protein [Hydrogenimonas thermophila]|uniref:type II secretion system F family protein n=1 Tax=Hydrogenimonas thermophila TaxID=223786 RepID=UPI002936EE86|nr:type II secretion system F family protein [Hydrogenimonas thermophila]WOE69709.1 type II secretion system F family protein [Hydrogenimonas thermophila]WOE72223.1 type II secretion system F family protein [Hydrogenimonas thermophila]
MKFFRISYKRGKTHNKTIVKAENRIEAVKKFYEMKLGVLIKIEEIQEPISMKIEKQIEYWKNPINRGKVNDEKYIAALDQIATMLDAGMPLNVSIEETAKNSDDPQIKMIFNHILADVEKGMSLSDSAARYSKQLGHLSVSMFKLGEETGSLADAVKKLAEILQEILDNRRKFKKATRYPLFTLAAMAIAFTIVIIYVVPQFESFFKSSHMELPIPTKILLWLENALINFGPYIIINAILIAVAIGYFYNKSDKFRIIMDRFQLKIYIIGDVTYLALIGRFFYLFRVLNDAGIPLLDALNMALEVVTNRYMQERLKRIPAAVEEGRSLHEGITESELCESMVIQMIKSGEMSGSLGKMLDKVTKIYKERFNYIVENIATLIEPIMIAAIAGFVLVLAMGIFLPMWNMTNVAN